MKSSSYLKHTKHDNRIVIHIESSSASATSQHSVMCNVARNFIWIKFYRVQPKFVRNPRGVQEREINIAAALLQNNLFPSAATATRIWKKKKRKEKSKHLQFFILSVSAWWCFPQSSFTVCRQDAVSAGTLRRKRWVPGAARPLMLLPAHCHGFLSHFTSHAPSPNTPNRMTPRGLVRWWHISWS